METMASTCIPLLQIVPNRLRSSMKACMHVAADCYDRGCVFPRLCDDSGPIPSSSCASSGSYGCSSELASSYTSEATEGLEAQLRRLLSGVVLGCEQPNGESTGPHSMQCKQ